MLLPRAHYYRHRHPKPPLEGPPTPRPTPARALAETEQSAVLDQLHSARFVDQPPREVFATLLDEGQYLCGWRTMYRLLAARNQTQERRLVRRHPQHAIPRLVARGPNEVWSWDITLLRGLAPRQFYYLYVILDIYSRYVVGWLVATCESETLAEALIEKTAARQGIDQGALTLHADRGSVMRSKVVSELLLKLGVRQSHSRPRVSNDNPFSESHFKYLKYNGTFPGRFESLGACRRYCRGWLSEYNEKHHHVGLALFTPAQVHFGPMDALVAARQQTLNLAYAAHPERFVKRPPAARRPPATVWINRPEEAALEVITANESVR